MGNASSEESTTSQRSVAVDLRVSGPVSFEIDGEEVDIRPRVKLFVAFLLVSERQQIHMRDFAHLCGTSEKQVSGRVRQIVLELRETPLRDLVYSLGYGHRGIRVAPSDVDHLRFRELVGRARGEAGEERAALLSSAVDELDGAPLEGLVTDGAEALRARLLAEYHAVWLDLIESLSSVGQLNAATRRAASAAMMWPRDEIFLRKQIKFLVATGGRSRAKEVYEEWVVTSGIQIRDFEAIAAEVLEEDADQGITQSAAYRPVPSQLPNTRSSLVGREEQYADLDQILLAQEDTAARLAVVTGMPGVGKSTLAINWAYANLRAFDAVLFENLSGFADREELSTATVLLRFLGQLGFSPDVRDNEEAAAIYRSALAERRVLVVIDNARNVDHVRLLLPGRGKSAAIVTSRDELAGLVAHEGARQVAVKPLEIDRGGELLRREIRRSGTGTKEDLDRLVTFCGGLPLALIILSAIANSRPDLSVAELAEQLHDERYKLDALGHHDLDLNLRVVFARSYRILSADARQVLERIAIHPGPTITMATLEVLNDNQAKMTRSAVTELRGASLLEYSPGRLQLHDLTRDFALTVAAEGGRGEVERLRRRALDYLLYSAAACDAQLDDRRLLPIALSDCPDAFMPGNPKRAMTWLRDEHATLLAAIGCAEHEGLDRYVWLLPLVLVTYEWRAHKYVEIKTLLESAVPAAQREAGPEQEATIHRMIAGTLRNLDDLRQAERHLDTALKLARSAGDVLGAARAQHLLASYHLESQPADLGEAARCLNEALAGFEEVGNAVGRAGAIAGLCSVQQMRGEYNEAERLCDEALQGYQQQCDRSGEANMYRQRGRIKAMLKDLANAVADFGDAESIYRDIDYDHRAADVLVEQAGVLAELGRIAEARKSLDRANAIYKALKSDEASVKIRRVDTLIQSLP